ncbi:hypothetical protein LSAT2_005247, partial [Lamellibrachia satsuma]
MVCHYIMTRGKHPYAPLDHELHTRVVNGKPDLSRIEHDFEADDLIKCMLADDPDTRPPAEQLRSHLYFWSDRDRYEFIAAVADEDEVEKCHTGPYKSNHFAKELENTKIRVFPNTRDWESLSVVPLYRADSKPFKKRYTSDYTTSICKLIRTMRNIQIHYGDQPETVRNVLGDEPFSYFNTHFPRLLFETYKVVTEFPEKKKLLSDFPCARKPTKEQPDAPPSTSDTPPSLSDAPLSTHYNYVSERKERIRQLTKKARSEKPANERALDVLQLLHKYGEPQLWHEVSHHIVSYGELDISRVITAANLPDLEFLLISGEVRD